MTTFSNRIPFLAAAMLIATLAVVGAWWLTGPSGQIQVSPATLDFDTVMIGSHVDRFVVVTNLGEERVVFDRLDVPAPFSTRLLRVELEAGESISIALDFAPMESGAAEAVFSLAGDDVAAEVALTGRGDGIPEVALDPPGLSFGEVGVGQVMRGIVRVANRGSGTLQLSQWRAPNPFRLVSPIDQVAPGETAELAVEFAPNGARAFSVALKLESNDPAAPYLAIPVSGSGVEGLAGASIDVSPGRLDFGAVPVGATRKGWISIRNHGAGTLTLASVTAPHGFEASTRSRQIAAGGVLAFPVVFRPDGRGPVQGALRIHSNDPAAEATVVELLGDGSDWDDPRVTAALTAPGSRELSTVGETPGTRYGARSGTARDGDPGFAGLDELDDPADLEGLASGPRILEGSKVGVGSRTSVIEDFDIGEFSYDPISGRIRLEDVDLAPLNMGLSGFFDLEPTAGFGTVNELGDIAMTMPIEIVDRWENRTRVEIMLTTGTATATHEGYPFTRTGRAVGPDGSFTLVGVHTLPLEHGKPLPNSAAWIELNGTIGDDTFTATVGGEEFTATLGGS